VKKRLILTTIFFVVLAAPAVFAQAVTGTPSPLHMFKFLGAAVAVGFATLGAGIAVGQIGAAAMAAMSENPDLSGKALPFVGLAEGIALWGFIVALMILSAAG